MCLDRLMDPEDRDYAPVKGRKYFEGWKAFRVEDGKLFTIWRGKNKPLPRGRWLKEADYREFALQLCCFLTDDVFYPPGFHIDLTERGARFWIDGAALKIRFRKPLAWGYEEIFPVVVAEEIFIPKES